MLFYVYQVRQNSYPDITKDSREFDHHKVLDTSNESIN